MFVKKKNKKFQILYDLYFQLVTVNILINMIQPCNQLVDTIITGKSLGAEALKVYALFLPMNSFLLAISCVLSKGAQVSTSHSIGKGDFKVSNCIVSTTLFLSAFCSLIFSLLCFIFSEKIAFILGSGSLTDQVSGYIRTYSIGIAPAILLDIFMCLMQLEGRKKLVIIGSLCVFAVNALGDLANIFIFKKGVAGMAFATSAANITGCLLLGLFFITRSSLFNISIKNFNGIYIRQILKNGFPSLAYYGSLVIRTIFMNILILNTFGKDVLVPMLVFTNFGTFADVLIGGHSDSVLVMSGILYGEKDKKGAASLLKISIISGTIMMFAVGALTAYFSMPLAKTFLEEKDMAFAPQSARALVLAAFYLVPDIISCIEKKYIQGIGNGTYVAVTNFLYNVPIVCALTIVLINTIGTDSLFLSFTGCYLVAAIVNTIYIIFFSFKRFESEDYKIISFTVNNLKECINVSEHIHNYCRENGLDNKKSYLISLFTEEICKNIIIHGFDKKRSNSIVIKLLLLNDKTTLCIKDNCVLFDPVHYYETMKEVPEGTADGIGIKLLIKMSKNVKYTTGFKLNNLMIEV